MRVTRFVCGCVVAAGAASASRAGTPGGPAEAGRLFTGRAVIVSEINDACGRPGRVRIRVNNARFVLGWGTRQFDIKVRRDGSFYATAGLPPAVADKRLQLVPTASGRLAGNLLVADYGTRWCHVRLTASAPFQAPDASLLH